MIVRTKSGNFQTGNISTLLDFLGVKKEASDQRSADQWSVGIHKVAGDVELIASVPFRLSADVETGQGLPWTLSTFDLDRFGERIDPQGWDFKRYMENPVVEWAHRYDIPAIGKIETLTIDDQGLHGLVFFNDKSFDPFGWSIGQRVKAGVIRAGSVGFRVMEIEIPDRETAKDGTSLIFRHQELLEFSICNVPANPYALAKTTEAAKTETTQELNYPTFWGGLFNNIQGE
ncbi:MAG: HK97 family phage prohead protease [Treponema sp.]|jgi:HK97 family phage prohead protease|nr:HK97 family phage prohead protease [Treponema sp.]